MSFGARFAAANIRTYANRAALIGGTALLLRPRALCDGNIQKQNDIPIVYQYKICPFCHRVKAYLDYLQIPYETVEVNPLTKAELSFSEYKKVPIAKIDDAVLNGSDVIISRISSTHASDKVKELMTEDTEKWMEWSEKRLAILLYPNITRTFAESWQCFSYAEDVNEWSAVQRLLVRTSGPVAMFFANGRIKKKYSIQDERAELLAVLDEWTEAVGEKRFLHGEKITMPDLMVFGVLRAIEGCPTFDVVMEKPAVKKWYDAVAGEVHSQEVCRLDRKH
eukprot:gene1588-1734_t